MPRKAEWVILSIVLLILTLCSILLPNVLRKGTYAAVYVDGVLLTQLPLSTDMQYHANGNTIVIEHGSCYMLKASCPDKLCVHSGEIQKTGQCICCLPNRVMVQIQGGTPDADTISY